jgi:hypothetical protein
LYVKKEGNKNIYSHLAIFVKQTLKRYAQNTKLGANKEWQGRMMEENFQCI